MSAEREGRAGTVASVVFALLVVATVGAFFVTQRLKRSEPVVRKIGMPKYISPNGDHQKDRARIRFRLPKSDRVTVSMTDAGGDEIRRLADRRLRRGPHRFVWNGRDGSGAIPPDGFYYLRVVLAGQGRGTITKRGIQLVTKPPAAKIVSVTPSRLGIGGGRRAPAPVTIRFAGPTNPPPVFSVYRTDLPGKARLVARFDGVRGVASGIWDARVNGAPAPAGTYAFGVTVRNPAYVAGSAPEHLPPTSRDAAPRTGLTIGGPGIAPPLEPVRAGRPARVTLTGARGRVRWSLTRLGAPKPLKRATAPGVRVGIPRKAATGVYVVRVETRAAGAVSAPIAVRGRGTGRVLVVLPAITWQGLNPVDDDADGFPDTLDNAPSVPLSRPLAGGRAPAGFRTEVAPLMRFLDERDLSYDLTTDVALAHGRGPRFGGHAGVAFAGSERWFTEDLDRELRRYADGGGRVASFGTDSFRRTVGVTATALAGPSPPQETNALGEQTAPLTSAAAPLVVTPPDELGLFASTDGFVGLFTRFEQSVRKVGEPGYLANAGRDAAKPAFAAYALGDGTVVRVGTPQWSGSLATDSEVGNVTESLWSFLSR